MAISIPHLMLALKDAEKSKHSLEIAASISNYFSSQISCLTFNESTQVLNTKFGAGKYAVERGNGTPSPKEISKIIKQKNPDLIILPISLGTTDPGVVTVSEANKLIDSFERMVLTVPESNEVFDYSHILVPIDTSFETRQKVPYAVALARVFKATLHVIGVSNDKGKDAEFVIKNYTRQVFNNIEEKGIKCTLDVRLGGNPTNQILEYAKEKNAGMIMIMTEQETNLTSFFSGKYSEQMIKNSPIPVLSIHPKDLIISDARL
ncbi:MAG: universal stress protein [Bacteroidota bacterium]|nr:universal stress protein [Bacteroidota bacterium]